MLGGIVQRLGFADRPGLGREIGDVLPALSEHRYLLLSTEKRDGRWVPTPVWFAPCDGALVVTSEAGAGKVKRIRRSGDVRVAPCTVRGRALGPEHDAVARLLEGAEARAARRALLQRYGLQQRVVDGIGLVLRRDRAVVALHARPGDGDRASVGGPPPRADAVADEPPHEG